MQKEFTRLLKWKKGLAKPLQTLLQSFHALEVFRASSYVSEEKSPNHKLRTIWISEFFQTYLLLPTSVLIFDEANCTLACDLEENQEKQGFDFQFI